MLSSSARLREARQIFASSARPGFPSEKWAVDFYFPELPCYGRKWGSQHALQSSVACVCKGGRGGWSRRAQRSGRSAAPYLRPPQVNNLIRHVLPRVPVCRTSLRQQNSCYIKNKEIFLQDELFQVAAAAGQQCRRGSSEAVCQLRSVSGPRPPRPHAPARAARAQPTRSQSQAPGAPGRSSVPAGVRAGDPPPVAEAHSALVASLPPLCSWLGPSGSRSDSQRVGRARRPPALGCNPPTPAKPASLPGRTLSWALDSSPGSGPGSYLGRVRGWIQVWFGPGHQPRMGLGSEPIFKLSI